MSKIHRQAREGGVTADRTVKVATPKTFIVVSSPHEDLAVALSVLLTDQKQSLHEKFNGSRLPSPLSMVNHFGDNVNREEIKDSAESVLGSKKNFMMVLSGYQNNEEWNNALSEFISTNDVAATFLSYGGEEPPAELARLFRTTATLPDNEEQAVAEAFQAIRQTRERSVVPFEEAQKRGIQTVAAPKVTIH